LRVNFSLVCNNLIVRIEHYHDDELSGKSWMKTNDVLRGGDKVAKSLMVNEKNLSLIIVWCFGT
jgi:hypothetical protein